MTKKAENPSKETLQKREWKEKRKHPCIDCGKLCDFGGQVCWDCANKRKTREHHPNWKGGKVKSHDYIMILKRGHHCAGKNGYVMEHILIWEEAHGKPLPPGWIIHHLNGIKYDNRPQNLVAMPNKKHYLVLQAKAKRIQELEALLNNQSQLL